MEELIHVETKLHDADKGTKSSMGSIEFRCPRASKILQEVAKDKHLSIR
jgi:hypothetical protein